MSDRHFKLSFPKPKAGIHECSWIIEAKDEAEAMTKFSNYLIDLKKQYSPQPLPIGKSTNPGKAQVVHEFMRRISQVSDPVALIVTLHMFVEHALNQILFKFCPNRDLTKYNFYKKLEIVYCINKIPKNMFHNLSKLNELRNKVAHDPDYDLTKMDLNYQDCPTDFDLSQYKPSYAANSAHNHIFNVLNIVAFVNYKLLHDHCLNDLGFRLQKVDGEQLLPVAAAKSDGCTV